MNRSLAFIWNARNRLHYICGRKCDQLNFENQLQLADAMKYKSSNGQQPVEKFLGELHASMELVKQQHLMFLYELGLEKNRKRRKKSKKNSKVEGLVVTDSGALNFTAPEKILESPELLMKIFEESARLKFPLSTESKRLVKEFSNLVNTRFRSAKSIF